MIWERLHEMKCPHCDGDLFDHGEGSDRYGCRHCTFFITKDRFEVITKHRRPNPGEVKKMKWQNLNEMKCPLCGEILAQEARATVVYRCTDGACAFGISEEKITMILADKNHPANRFFKKGI